MTVGLSLNGSSCKPAGLPYGLLDGMNRFVMRSPPPPALSKEPSLHWTFDDTGTLIKRMLRAELDQGEESLH